MSEMFLPTFRTCLQQYAVCYTILTRSVLSFLADFSLQFLFLFSCTDLFIILTIRPLRPSILCSGDSSKELSSLVSAPPPPIKKSNNPTQPSSQSVSVSLPSLTWSNILILANIFVPDLFLPHCLLIPWIQFCRLSKYSQCETSTLQLQSLY